MEWGRDSEMAPLANPTPKKKAKPMANVARRGDRVRIYVGSSQLWDRLDLDRPATYGKPETGFPDEIIAIAKRGRCHVRMGIEESAVKAYDSWRSLSRTHTRHGCNIRDLHEEYYVSLRNYGRRYATLRMQ